MALIPIQKHAALKAKFSLRRIRNARRPLRHARTLMYQRIVRRNRLAHKRHPVDNFKTFKLSNLRSKPIFPKPIIIASEYLPNIIPRRLSSRSFPEPDQRKVAPFAGDTADLSPKILRDAWALLAIPSVGLFKYISVEPPKRLAKVLNIVVTDTGLSQGPTHVFAVHSPAPWPPSPSLRLAHRPRFIRTVHLFPVRPLMWLANCSKLPAIPPKRDPQYKLIPPEHPRMPPACLLSLPAIPLRIPSTETFEPLQQYLHTQDFVALIRELLPIMPPDPELKTIEEVWPRFTDDLATCCNRRELAAFARRVLGLYKNMVALRICDKAFWRDVLKLWDCLVEAVESRNIEEQVAVPSSDLYVCISADPDH
ncbi:hypothetical protein OBBRIDRAFT_837980 [Obba rivulosa]|uniref:Uncharacterized protein n=1 Tax=Obba rivulosa TaxID=1052685 RepID=A0A8E2DIB6_9APHY|nr:hypothetical protein OBBRIDRAFT_837980 [Obba rivulosa]